MLADTENTGNRNVIKREAQEFLKHEDLTTDMQRM